MAAASLPVPERQRHTGKVSWSNGDALPYRDIAPQVIYLPGYSAHTDQAGLLAWLFSTSPKTGQLYSIAQHIFVQHGNDNEREALAARISCAGDGHQFELEITLPADPGQWFDIEAENESEKPGRCARELRNQMQFIEAKL